MNHQERKAYEQSYNFQRNETIWIFSTVDKLAITTLATQFNLSEKTIEQIITTHQTYWNASKDERENT